MAKERPTPAAAREWVPEAALAELERALDHRRKLARSPKRQRRLRIAARRLEAILLAFGDRMPPHAARKLTTSLHAFRSAAGSARDAGLALELAAPRLERYLDAARTVAKVAQRRERAATEALKCAVSKAARDELVQGVELLVDAAVVTPRSDAARAAPRRALARYLSRLREALESDLDNAENLHRVRRRFKEVRYALEVLRPLLPAPRAAFSPARLARRLAVIQKSLGDLGDLRIVIELLRAARRGAPPDAAHELRSIAGRAEADSARLARQHARILRSPRTDALLADLTRLLHSKDAAPND